MNSPRWYVPSWKRAVLLTTAKLFLSSCGGVSAESNGVGVEDGKQQNMDDADLTVGEDGRVRLEFTADYRFTPVDVLVIGETTGVLAGAPFADRLAQAGSTLATRLLFSELDVQVGFLSAGIPPRPPEGTPQTVFAGELTEVDGPAILTKDRTDFSTLIRQRMAPANLSQSQQPLTALKRMFERSTLPESRSAGFFRDGAFLAVVYVHHSDETAEQLLPDDITKLLNERKGVGRWSVSAIVPDWEGCEISTGRLTNAADYVRRNLVLRLAQQSGGLVESLCKNTFAYFFDSFVGDGTNSRYWLADLPVRAMWESIQLTADKTEFTSWRYTPGELVMKLPTTIPRGSAVEISFEIDDGTKENVALDRDIPYLQERKLSPEEIAFNVQINPIIRGSCGGGTCHSSGSGLSTYVDNYRVVVNNRAAILDRIQRPDGDVGKMPQGRTIGATELQRLIDYLSAVP